MLFIKLYLIHAHIKAQITYSCSSSSLTVIIKMYSIHKIHRNTSLQCIYPHNNFETAFL